MQAVGGYRLPDMRFTAGAATDTGLVRRANEDAFFVGARVVAVADGMGGHLGGGTASVIAVGVCAELAAIDPLTPGDVVTAVGRANHEVVRRAALDPSLHGMGTTLTGVAVVEVEGAPCLAVFNVGDSRVYRLEGGRMRQVTVDHSEVQELVTAGRLTAEEARVHPARNVITRSVGSDPGPAVDVVVLAPQPADRFLVCSDGLTGELDDTAIEDLLATDADPQAVAELLVAAAVAAGGRDNVTVVVADVTETDADGA